MLPQWRDAFLSINIISQSNSTHHFSKSAQLQANIVDRIIPLMEAPTLGSAVYLSEGNWAQPNWQHALYGTDHYKLLEIKD